MPFLFRIQRGNNLFISRISPSFKRIAKPFTGIICLVCSIICKHELLIKLMISISYLFLTELMPCINHSRFCIPHIAYLHVSIEFIFMLFSVLSKFAIHQLHNVILVSRPQPSIFDPHRIKVTASNHEIFRRFDLKLRINLDIPRLFTASRYCEKIEHYIL